MQDENPNNTLSPLLSSEEMESLLGIANPRALIKEIGAYHHWESMMLILSWMLQQHRYWSRLNSDSRRLGSYRLTLLGEIKTNSAYTTRITVMTLRSAFNFMIRSRSSSNVVILINSSGVRGSRKISRSHLDHRSNHSEPSPEATNLFRDSEHYYQGVPQQRPWQWRKSGKKAGWITNNLHWGEPRDLVPTWWYGSCIFKYQKLWCIPHFNW